MPKVTSKRQITLPKAHCERLGIEPGDDVDIYVHEDNITIMKLSENGLRGFLAGTKKLSNMTDEESRDSAIEERR